MTEVNLDSIFSSLRDSADDLNQASETANATLADAEARLVALNIGIEVWHPTPLTVTDAEPGRGPYETSEEVADLLGFARVKGKWCLALKRVRRVNGFYEGDTECPFTNVFLEAPPGPILKQSRSLRINALASLPNFLQHITDHVNSLSSELDTAVEELSG